MSFAMLLTAVFDTFLVPPEAVKVDPVPIMNGSAAGVSGAFTWAAAE